eukprot:scaffold1208_cov299-Prasinococcus_capsulatus_cf.AAC.2
MEERVGGCEARRPGERRRARKGGREGGRWGWVSAAPARASPTSASAAHAARMWEPSPRHIPMEERVGGCEARRPGERRRARKGAREGGRWGWDSAEPGVRAAGGRAGTDGGARLATRQPQPRRQRAASATVGRGRPSSARLAARWALVRERGIHGARTTRGEARPGAGRTPQMQAMRGPRA